MLCQEVLLKMENFLFSSSMMSRCIDNMSHDAKEALCNKLINNTCCTQVAELTDFSNNCHNVTLRFINYTAI
jgi:hypothetical protein